MRRIAAAFVAGAALLGAAVVSPAEHLENRSWSCTAAEKFSVARLGSEEVVTTGISIAIDGALNFTFSHPDAGDYDGTIVEKGSKKFQAFPSPSSLAAFEDYLVATAEDAGLSDIEVIASSWKVKGKVDGDGNLLVKSKAAVKGTALFAGKTRKGKVKHKAIIVGTPDT